MEAWKLRALASAAREAAKDARRKPYNREWSKGRAEGFMSALRLILRDTTLDKGTRKRILGKVA